MQCKMHSQREENIFGTPPEPLFNMKAASLSRQLLEEWLILLAEENSMLVRSADVKQYIFRKGHVAEVIFLLSDRLRLRNDAKYLALELYNRFMIQHINDLYKHVQKSGSLTAKKDWMAVEERVRNQLLLRVVSCCQLASKLSSHYRIVTVSRAQRFLAETGHHYTIESILKSELRVLKTLAFKVNILSPLMYLECLLEIIGHNKPGTEVKIYHSVAVKLLDFVYIKHNKIYKGYHDSHKTCKDLTSPSESLSGKLIHMQSPNLENMYLAMNQKPIENESSRSKCAAVEADKMLLAAGIITAAVFIVDHLNMEKVVSALERICRVSQKDMMDFCTVLIKSVQQNNTEQ